MRNRGGGRTKTPKDAQRRHKGNQRGADLLENETEASTWKPLCPQLCGCNFQLFAVTRTQAVHMKTLYLWAWNAL